MQINFKNYEIVSHVNNVLIDLINEINRKKITENKHPDKVNNIAEEVLHISKQQKGKGRPSDLAGIAKDFDCSRLKVLTPTQMLQGLSKATALVQAGTTSEKLLINHIFLVSTKRIY